MGTEKVKPRILALDIETSPIVGYSWGLYDVTIGLNQIHTDWSILAWAAKWVGEDEIFYADTSKQRNKRDDVKMLKGIHKLLSKADVVLTQNGKSFDIPKLNARFIEHGFDPLPNLEHIDTKRLAKKRFKFTSNSLEYLCKVLKTKHQKLKHERFPGFDLWREFLAGNPDAAADMRKYNEHDVMALEEVYLKLRPWGVNVDLSKYTKDQGPTCSVCTSHNLNRYGFAYKGQGKFQRYRCGDCGASVRGKDNLLSKVKRAALKPGS